MNKNVQFTTWNEVKNSIKKLNLDLFNVLNKINPNSNLKLIKVSYNYADYIVNNGHFFLPHSDGLVYSISDEKFKKIKSLLNYSNIPLFLTLNKDCEVFIDENKRIIPLNLFNMGSLLGIFETMDYIFSEPSSAMWSVSAGIRSVFFLSKVSDAIGFKKIRQHYKIPSTEKLKTMSDHWNIFKYISNNEENLNKWKCEILIFTKDWFFQSSKDQKWLEFDNYLYRMSWKQAKFAIGKIENSLTWESFVETISLRNLKPRPYLSDQIKHILFMLAGKVPGFRPITTSNNSLPLEVIQNAFCNIYGMNNYLPTLMGICPLETINTNTPIYYSLSYPTILEGSPINKTSSTRMVDLKDIKLLIDTLKNFSKPNNTFLELIVEKTDFTYYHVDHDNHGEIDSAYNIPKYDHSFIEDQLKFKERTFCSTSPFFKGCIKVMVNS